jgi:hypothetical protein
MSALALVQICTGMGAQAVLAAAIVRWEHLRVLAAACMPGTWLLFGVSFARANSRDLMAPWRWAILASFLLPVVLVSAGHQGFFTARLRFDAAFGWVLPLGCDYDDPATTPGTGRGHSVTGPGVVTSEWPGNVRELENRIKRAVLMAQGPQITPADLGLDAPSSQYLAPSQGLREARAAFEKDLIQRALAKNGGNISRTASELGVSRPTLHDLVTKYALER